MLQDVAPLLHKTTEQYIFQFEHVSVVIISYFSTTELALLSKIHF